MDKIQKALIFQSLSKVIDPDLKKNIVELGMVEKLSIEEGKISFTLQLTTPACPLKNILKQDCITNLEKDIPQIKSIKIDFGVKHIKQIDRGEGLSQVEYIIAVASGKGGVGKSSMTANLAISLHKMGAKVGVLDADIYGPSIPTLFGTEGKRAHVKKINNKNYLIPIEKQGIKLLSIGYLTNPKEAVIWRGPMISSIIKQFLFDCHWGALDYLLIDLPPGTGDIQLTITQVIKTSGVVIVTTPQKMALIDVVKSIEMFQKKPIQVPILGIIENMSYFSIRGNEKEKFYIFGKDGGKYLSQQYGIPFLGEVPILQYIREDSDGGTLLEGFENKNKQTIFTSITEQVIRNAAIKQASGQNNEK